MSDYIVSARKYRPQTFDTVVGQEHITTTLKNAIRNQHLAHAFLFCGPRGVGKTTCARILAKTINCEHPTADMEACGVCSSCVSFGNSSSFNVFELDAASNNSVEDIRELTNQVRFAPQQGKYKVYIIDEVHMLSSNAFNAFLKTLEEPPPYAIFILATTEKHKILPTILSRCQIFDFKRITTHDIVSHLQGIASKESMIAQEAALHVIAQKSEGCMRDALSMLDRIASFTNGMLTYNGTMEHLNLLDADFYFGLVDTMLSQDVAGTLLQLDKALEKGFEGDVIISGLAEHFRNLLLCKDARMARLLDVPNEHRPMYVEKANQAPPSFILSALNVINQCELEYKSANNKRLHVEMCLIRLCFLLHAVSGKQQPGADDLKKNFNTVTTPVAAPVPQPANVVPTFVQSAPPPVYNAPTVQPSVVREEPVIPAPQPKPVEAPIARMEAPASATAPAIPRREPPATGARRLSKGLIENIESATSGDTYIRDKVMTLEEATAIFQEYKKKLLAESKGMVHGQFELMKIVVFPPDEIRIVSPSELTDTYARDQRNILLDFFREKARMLVRLTTELVEDKEISNAQKTTVLSKSEIYEAMAAKNPSLQKLKDGLGMQIEY